MEEVSEHIYKAVEIVGSSTTDVSDAMRKAIAKASQTIRNMDWMEVVGIRGHIENNEIQHFQVTIKVGFRLE
jgi:flavin-binding protein dodecin